MEAREVMEHACARAKERYGLPVSAEEYDALCRQVESGAAPWIRRRDNDADLYAVTHRHLTMWAVYCHNTGQILTFLDPKDYA